MNFQLNNQLTKGMDKDSLRESILEHIRFSLGKDSYSVTDYDNFLAVSKSTWDRMIERWLLTQRRYHDDNVRRVYYLSMEFLTGRHLGNTVLNLEMEDELNKALGELGIELEEVEELEHEPGLGNGGLGRLAACFLDSMATLGIPALGMGIRYVYGIFKQKIVDGYQVEMPDNWLRDTNPWEIIRPARAVRVRFYGRVQEFTDRNGRQVYHWTDTKDVQAVPYDYPTPGYGNNVVNTLKLWAAISPDELDLSDFNQGDYMGACESKVLAENITKVLYPNDNFFEGKELRLKQQYFFVAASLSDIIRRHKAQGHGLAGFTDKVAIQLNDTHPAIAIPELMRILIDEEDTGWDEAWEIVTKTFSYTNHTLLPEALEKWDVKFFEKLLPRHLQIIYEINRRFLIEVSRSYPGDNEILGRMSIIEGGDEPKIRMAFLSVVGSHTVNGVAAIHTKLLKSTVMQDFANFYPDKFQNKTNGVTQRRWIKKCNPGLSAMLDEKIGKKWVTHLEDLDNISKFTKDKSFRDNWWRVKLDNKKRLANYIENEYETPVNLESIFDIQIKRLHEYKRQLMNVLFIVHRYLQLKDGEKTKFSPRTMIFGAKAAPGYDIAKKIIKLINSVGQLINHDSDTADYLRCFFLANYRVSLAEKIIPAADLSEQISTAGLEASGTGNMKLALNGALTIGTLDGANIEILEQVGDDNMFVFGMTADEVLERRKNYKPLEVIEKSPNLKRVLNLIESDFFCPDEPGIFQAIIDNLKQKDYFMVLADFDAYVKAQESVDEAWKDREGWIKKSIINVAKNGHFSSDRTIRQYAEEIWKVKPTEIRPQG